MKPPVLLLDDDRKWLQICLARLPQAKYTLELTAALPDALERLAVTRHPVVVCDLRLIGMGDRGGFELLDSAKTISEFTKVIIVTAYGGAATDIAREAMEKGAITYLTKPLDFAELDECIAMAIQSWQQEVEEMVNLGFLAEGPELTFLGISTEGMRPGDRVSTDHVTLAQAPAEAAGEVPPRTALQRRYLARLRQILTDRFSEEDLQTLCFDLGVDYSDLPARGRAGKARELVAYLECRNRVSELVETGKRTRPDISWDDFLQVTKAQKGNRRATNPNPIPTNLRPSTQHSELETQK
jgi:ActR/RegA family two-component response regulator